MTLNSLILSTFLVFRLITVQAAQINVTFLSIPATCPAYHNHCIIVLVILGYYDGDVCLGEKTKVTHAA
jgi:hypothetical protein